MSKDKRNFLKEKCRLLNIELSEKQIDQFMKYYELLVEWNKVMNLTAITDIDEVIIKHFVDSVALCKYVEMDKEASLIDIGTGAGFPGIPLKIVCPELKITLLDSLNKRISFLNEVIQQLELNNISTIHGRAEDFAKDNEYREKYDFCVSRAVANLSTLTELCSPFVKVGGYFVSYKSEKCNEEIDTARVALDTLNCEVTSVENYILPNSDMVRNLVFIKKADLTPSKYPRKAGMPSKKPL